MISNTFHIAIPTAFNEDETLNVEATISYIKYLYNCGIKSVLVCGSTGEQHSMTLNEKFQLIDGLEQEQQLLLNMEILFGVASIRQTEAETLATRISETLISGILLGYPPYILPTQEEAIAYSKKIISLANKPTILYNNPRRTGFDLSADSIVELSQLDLVVGLKEAGDKSKVQTIQSTLKKPSFLYYAGGEIDLEEKINTFGFNALSSILGNINPTKIKDWFQHIVDRKDTTSTDYNYINEMRCKLFTGSPLVNMKKELQQQNISMGICRKPLGS